MYSKLFSETTHLLALPVFALIMFVTIFAAVVIRTFCRSPATFSDVANLPLAQEKTRD
jgi:hypothetical protein